MDWVHCKWKPLFFLSSSYPNISFRAPFFILYSSSSLIGLVSLTAAVKSLQLCLTLWDPIDGSPPGSPIPGILQARTLEWVAISFSNAWKWKVKVKSLSHVQLLATPMDCSLPGFSAHGIFQARVLERGAIAFSRLSLTVTLKKLKLLTFLSNMKASSSHTFILTWWEVIYSWNLWLLICTGCLRRQLPLEKQHVSGFFPYLPPPHPIAPVPDPFLWETRAERRSQGVPDQDCAAMLLHRPPGSGGGVRLTPSFRGSLGMLLGRLPRKCWSWHQYVGFGYVTL